MILFWRLWAIVSLIPVLIQLLAMFSPLVVSSFKIYNILFILPLSPQFGKTSNMHSVDFWRSLEVSQFILNVIIQGYRIPFFHLPTPFSKANNASARNISTFVSEAVNDLLKFNLAQEIFCAPDIINPLSVPSRSSGKQRLILDLRTLSSTIKSLSKTCPWPLRFSSRSD